MALTISACDDFLEVRPSQDIVVPNSLENLQALLDASTVMNTNPILGFLGADNYYTTDQGWSSFRNPFMANAYIWNEEIFEGETSYDWYAAYQQVMYANTVLELLPTLDKQQKNTEHYTHLQGAALFFRARAFYNLLQIFAPPYDTNNATDILGIPLKQSADINSHEKRAPLNVSYEQVIKDLETANTMLPENAIYPSRPSQRSVSALLARIYLSMRDYQNAENYADQALEFNNQLLNYNDLDSQVAYPFSLFNKEVIFHSNMLNYSDLTFRPLISVSRELYNSYSDGDLRKVLYFTEDNTGMIQFKGSYTGDLLMFSGLCNDELFLIKAECAARHGNIELALNYLNSLLSNRFTPDSFTPINLNNPAEVLDNILTERRKELVYRGLRWSDLRRLNTEPEFAITLERTILGKIYTLAPNDSKYVYPIPPDEVELGNLRQNER